MSIYDDAGNPHYGGGGPLVVQRIAQSLVEQYDVVIVTGGYRGARRVHRPGTTYIPLPTWWAGPRSGQLLYSLLLLLLAPWAVYDLWIESFTPPFSSSLIPLVTRRPVIGLAQSLCGGEMARRYNLSFFRAIERTALRSYSDIVVLNEYDGAQVTSWSPRSRVHYIPNVTAVDVAIGPEADEGQYALYLGRIEFEQKGLGLLFDAYRQVDDLLPLVIAGTGRKAEVDVLRQALGAVAVDRVRWVGHVAGADKTAALTGAAFVVVPSRDESFCLVALEAMAHGRPVVHFDLPQLRWIPEDCGLKVPCFDAAALAAAAKEFSVNTPRRAAAGRRAREFARTFVGRQSGDAYRRLVAEVLSPSEAASGAASAPIGSAP